MEVISLPPMSLTILNKRPVNILDKNIENTAKTMKFQHLLVFRDVSAASDHEDAKGLVVGTAGRSQKVFPVLDRIEVQELASNCVDIGIEGRLVRVVTQSDELDAVQRHLRVVHLEDLQRLSHRRVHEPLPDADVPHTKLTRLVHGDRSMFRFGVSSLAHQLHGYDEGAVALESYDHGFRVDGPDFGLAVESAGEEVEGIGVEALDSSGVSLENALDPAVAGRLEQDRLVHAARGEDVDRVDRDDTRHHLRVSRRLVDRLSGDHVPAEEDVRGADADENLRAVAPTEHRVVQIMQNTVNLIVSDAFSA